MAIQGVSADDPQPSQPFCLQSAHRLPYNGTPGAPTAVNRPSRERQGASRR